MATGCWRRRHAAGLQSSGPPRAASRCTRRNRRCCCGGTAQTCGAAGHRWERGVREGDGACWDCPGGWNTRNTRCRGRSAALLLAGSPGLGALVRSSLLPYLLCACVAPVIRARRPVQARPSPVVGAAVLRGVEAAKEKPAIVAVLQGAGRILLPRREGDGQQKDPSRTPAHFCPGQAVTMCGWGLLIHDVQVGLGTAGSGRARPLS